MNLRMLTCLSLPALLFACGGSDQPAELTEGGPSGRPLAPQLAAPAPSRALPGSSPSTLDTQQLLQAQVATASITLDQATDTALAANPGSELLEADLDGSGANVRYEVELRLADGQVVEVQIDAVTGDIIAMVPEDADDDDDGDDAVLDCTVSISALEAQEVAEAEAGGTAVEVEIDDGCEFEVTVDTGTGFVEVEVAADGSVRQVETDDDDLADDDDDDQDDDDDDDDQDDDDDDDQDDDDDGDD